MTMFFEDYEIYRPDINKKDEKNEVAILNCFHSFGFNFVCDVKFKDIKNKKNNQ